MVTDGEGEVARDRRRLLEMVVKGSAGIIAAATLLPGAAFLFYPALEGGRTRRRKVVFQRPADIDTPTFVTARLEGQEETAPGVFYKMAEATPVVLSSVCTHAGCSVTWHPERSQFLCPCHGGVFDGNGKSVAGPPPRPLTRLVATRRG